MKKMRGMVALGVALSVTVGASALRAQKDDKKQEEKRSKAEQVDILTLATVVDAVSAARIPAPADIPVTWSTSHAFRAPDGTTYVPFTVAIDRSKLASPSVALYVRLMPKPVAGAPAPAAKGKDKDAPAYPSEKIDFPMIGADGVVSRFVQVKPGDYDLYVAVKDKGSVEKTDKNYSPKVGVLKKDLSIPDFTKTELSTSSVLLARSIEQVTGAENPLDDPYVFGRNRIVLARDGKYAKADTLEIIYWVYGATGDAAGRPDLVTENNFYQRTPDGMEKFFNKTPPQALNGQNLPPDFPIAILPGTLQVPLLSFPAGDYRLEIKITDKPSGKTLTQNVTFTVAAS